MGSGNEISQEVGREVTKHSEDWQNAVRQGWDKTAQPGKKAMPGASAADQLPGLVLTDNEGEGCEPGEHKEAGNRALEIKNALGELAGKNLAQHLFPEIAASMPPRDSKNHLIDGLSGAEAAKILRVGKDLDADNSRMIDAALAASRIPCLRRRTADGMAKDAAIHLPGVTDKLEVSLLLVTYQNVLAAVGTNRPVSTFVGDVLPPLKGTVPEDNLKNVINILSQFALPALDADLGSKD